MNSNLATARTGVSDVPDVADTGKVYVLGAGAIGLSLAAHLASDGRSAVAVRTSRHDVFPGKITVTVRCGADAVLTVPVETVSLSQLTHLEGVIVLACKSHANGLVAAALARKAVKGPLVIMQNGIGVEQPFLGSPFPEVYRCVLYATGQAASETEVTFRPIASSPVGTVRGSRLERCVFALSTEGFPFHGEPEIQREVWRKTIINSVFNSICPLLDIDNGVFVRDAEAARLAGELVSECVVLAAAAGLPFTEAELMDQIMAISRGSEGVLISTLQDIKHGRKTEIESLNLELARIASSMTPRVNLSKTEILGKLVSVRSRQVQGSPADVRNGQS